MSEFREGIHDDSQDNVEADDCHNDEDRNVKDETDASYFGRPWEEGDIL